MKGQQLKKLEKNNNHKVEGDVSDKDDDEDALKVDEAKVDENKQMEFASTIGDGSTGTVRFDTISLFVYLLFDEKCTHTHITGIAFFAMQHKHIFILFFSFLCQEFVY